MNLSPSSYSFDLVIKSIDFDTNSGAIDESKHQVTLDQWDMSDHISKLDNIL